MYDNSFGYELESVASHYATNRPIYPKKLYDMIFTYLHNGSEADDRRGVAVDAGCGSGQSTGELCKHFKSVIAIDNSEAQLAESKQFCADHRNVEFKLLAAENLGSAFDEESVDLVAAGAALHWFDAKAFYSASLRVLKPRGAMAAFCWKIPTLDNEEANEIFHHQIFKGIFKPYWPAKVRSAFDFYQEDFSTMKLFFEDPVRDDSLEVEHTLSRNEMLGLFKTFPQYFHYKAAHPEHPDDVDIALDKLMEIYKAGSPDEKVAKGSHKIFLIMGRKPSKSP